RARRKVFRDAEARQSGAEAVGANAPVYVRAARGRAGPGRAAACVHGVAHLADLLAGGCRRRCRCNRAGIRALEPPVQETGLRASNRAAGVGAAVLALAWIGVRSPGDRATGTFR